MRRLFIVVLFSFLALVNIPSPARAQSDLPVVHAVLFYAPTCGHCHYVITEVLPPLFEQHGDQLQMIGVDINQPDGRALFQAALEKFGVEYAGVPFLVIGEVYLMGDVDIPGQFPGLIEAYLAQGGVDWPALPGMAEILVQAGYAEATGPAASPTVPAEATALPEATPLPDPAPSPTDEPLRLTGESQASLRDRLAQDPAGNGLAILVLAGMIVTLGLGGRYFLRSQGSLPEGLLAWSIPILCAIGLGVAGYLSYVEITHTDAVCGPVGDCNTVQQSEYARLFGILPIGVLGMAGYVAILAAWVAGRYAQGKLADLAWLALLTMTVFSTLFSIYLTFLEPFVIGATCAWCVTSAILMTALMLLSLAPGKLAFRRLKA